MKPRKIPLTERLAGIAMHVLFGFCILRGMVLMLNVYLPLAHCAIV